HVLRLDGVRFGYGLRILVSRRHGYENYAYVRITSREVVLLPLRCCGMTYWSYCELRVGFGFVTVFEVEALLRGTTYGKEQKSSKCAKNWTLSLGALTDAHAFCSSSKTKISPVPFTNPMAINRPV